jgi:hypothetical protein
VALQNGYCPGHDVDPDQSQVSISPCSSFEFGLKSANIIIIVVIRHRHHHHHHHQPHHHYVTRTAGHDRRHADRRAQRLVHHCIEPHSNFASPFFVFCCCFFVLFFPLVGSVDPFVACFALTVDTLVFAFCLNNWLTFPSEQRVPRKVSFTRRLAALTSQNVAVRKPPTTYSDENLSFFFFFFFVNKLRRQLSFSVACVCIPTMFAAAVQHTGVRADRAPHGLGRFVCSFRPTCGFFMLLLC